MAAPKTAKDGTNGMNGRDGRDSRPVPDPTVQTDQLVTKAIIGLREILETRADGVDREIAQLQQDIRQRPHDIEVQINHLQALENEQFLRIEEKFKTVMVEFVSVQTQFSERDVRGRDAALANTTAVNAALQAQKEAAGEQAKSFTLSIDKSEKGTLEQIAQQRVLLETMKQTLDGKVEDVKERLTRIEGIAAGAITTKAEVVQTHTAGAQNIGMIVGVVGMVVVLVTLAERLIR